MESVRKKKTKKRVRRFNATACIVVAAIFAFNCLTVISALTPQRYEISVGGVAKETIKAPRMVENVTATEALRDAARNGVSVIYTTDTDLADELISEAKSFFSALTSFRNAAEDIRAGSIPTATGADGTVYALEDTRSWQEVLSENELLAMTLKLPMSIDDTALGYALLEADSDDLSLLEELVMSKLQVQLRAGVTQDALETTLAEVNKELQITTLPVRLKSLGEMLFNTYLQPTNVEDTLAMTRARDEAAAAVETIYYALGAVIVEQGQTVTDDQMQVLTSLDLIKGANANKMFNVGVVAYLFLVYAAFLAYLRAFEPNVYGSNKNLIILLLLFVISLAIQWGCYLIDPRIMPAIFAVMLAAILISRTVAQAVNITTAMTFSLLAGGSGSTMLSSDSFLAMAAMLVIGQVTILFAAKSEKRGSMIASGIIGGLAGAWVIVTGSAILGTAWNSILVYASLTLAASLILSVFCVGMLSMWENMFDVITPARLHELANTNHPLLKKMMTAAPGTYHHSLMTASLAEGAAEAIGADALLARTGALYHDVGKLRRPMYFKENQGERNIHDTLPPAESASYIIGHVKDADALLAKYHMPSAIRRIASEHHGTTLASYFYYKAKQQATDEEPVSEKAFRYPGGTPSTRESAIVMLSDSCEAAVRSLHEPSKDMIADMTDKVIQGKIDDGQLVSCPLTFAELAKIEKSFLITFGGLMHERIRYPEETEK